SRGAEQRRADHGVRSASFFFLAAAPNRIYTLSLHDALPISPLVGRAEILAVAGVPMQGQVERGVLEQVAARQETAQGQRPAAPVDRKSTRLNSSHVAISYAVFCLKNKRNRGTPSGPRGSTMF